MSVKHDPTELTKRLMFGISAICLMVVIAVTLVVTIADGATLPDSLQEQVLKLEAAGNFVAADNILKQFNSYLRIKVAQDSVAAHQKAVQDSLAARQKAAQVELYRRTVEARIKLWTIWDKQVTVMPIDSVWVWAGNDRDKAMWLANRYHFSLAPKVPAETQLAMIKAEIEGRRKLRSEVSRQLGSRLTTLTSQVDRLSNRVEQTEEDVIVLRNALTDQSFDVKAALSVLENVTIAIEANSGSKILIQAARKAARKQ